MKQLAVPLSEYQDKSPKGSVDIGIRRLIDDINNQEGLVTTSSCAGRISIFLEGRKKYDGLRPPLGGEIRVVGSGTGGADALPASGFTASLNSTFSSSGGKGGGGTWLYVSHDPVPVPHASEGEYFHKLFGLSHHHQLDPSSMRSESLRYVHFKFEPMVGISRCWWFPAAYYAQILHVLTASLSHAQMVLTAASQAGFRESGAINLARAAGEQPMPMVGVRCLGLGFDSIIGCLHQEDDHGNHLIQSLVTEEYMHTLIDIANGKFLENAKRTEDFRMKLLQRCGSAAHNEQTAVGKPLKIGWEDADTRRERKRAEGLRKKQALRDMRERDRKQSGGVEAERIEHHSE